MQRQLPAENETGREYWSYAFQSSPSLFSRSRRRCAGNRRQSRGRQRNSGDDDADDRLAQGQRLAGSPRQRRQGIHPALRQLEKHRAQFRSDGRPAAGRFGAFAHARRLRPHVERLRHARTSGARRPPRPQGRRPRRADRHAGLCTRRRLREDGFALRQLRQLHRARAWRRNGNPLRPPVGFQRQRGPDACTRAT